MIALILLLAAQDAPTATLTLNGGSRVTRVTTVRAEAKLAAYGGGDVQMSLTTDAGAPPSWVPFREVTILDLPAGDGEKNVILRLRDGKGVESKPVLASIRLDATPPLARVLAPERVAGSEVTMTFDVLDAVGVQFTEDINAWSPWELYSTPKTIPLSKGAGQKVIFVRFRDEAGNESAPGRVVVEAQSPTPSVAAGNGIRSVALGVHRKPDAALELVVWIEGTGLKEMRAELDGVELLGRGPVVIPWKTDLQPSDGPRRLALSSWDGAGREHKAVAVFRDGDAPAMPRPGFGEGSPRECWRVGILGGVLPLGVRFERMTFQGNRDIKRGVMALARAEGSWTFSDPWFVQVAVDWAGGEDVRVLSAGGDIGARFAAGRLAGMEVELGFLAGAYYSQLDVNLSGFGTFKGDVLLRVGGTAAFRVTDSLWAEAMIDFRHAEYRYDGVPGIRDKDARGSGVAAGLGLTWRF